MITGRSKACALWVALTLPVAAFAHGGDADDHTNAAGLAQMPGSLSDTSFGGDGGFGQMNSAKPTIRKLGGGYGGGDAPAADTSAALTTAPAAPPRLAAPGHSSGAPRSVPDQPGIQTAVQNLDRSSLYSPRADGSMQIYQDAYNADTKLMNVWRESLSR